MRSKRRRRLEEKRKERKGALALGATVKGSSGVGSLHSRRELKGVARGVEYEREGRLGLVRLRGRLRMGTKANAAGHLVWRWLWLG